MRPKKITFSIAAQTAIKDAETRVKLGQNSPRLVSDYKDRLKHCDAFFGDMPISKIDARKVRDFRDELASKGLKSTAIAPVMSFVSVVLRLAHEDGLIMQKPPIPRPSQKPTPRSAFSLAEYKQLLQTLRSMEKASPPIMWKASPIDKELRWLVTFMVNGFFRPGDLFVLQHKHITIVPSNASEPAYLRIAAPASKGHANPIITMPVAVPIYNRLLSHQKAKGFGKPDDYLFLPHRRSRKYAHEIIRRQFRIALKKADLLQGPNGDERSLYSLRHSAITMRLQQGNVDLLTLARACRTSVEMIDRFYASSLTAEANRDKLFSFRHPTRYLAVSDTSTNATT
ncbi:tyrosine-type recombinase/integrase [Brevundimonas sp. GN22]